MFTSDNTNGYTQTELDVMNNALNTLMRYEDKNNDSYKSILDHKSADVERLMELVNDYISDYTQEDFKNDSEMFRENESHVSDCFNDTLDIIDTEFKNIPENYRSELNHVFQLMIVDIVHDKTKEKITYHFKLNSGESFSYTEDQPCDNADIQNEITAAYCDMHDYDWDKMLDAMQERYQEMQKIKTVEEFVNFLDSIEY
jgi:hypothetical protein